MRSNKLFGFAVFLLIYPVAGSCRDQMPLVCQEFFESSPQEQAKQFPTFPVEQQLDIYRCEMRRKPPNLARAYDIAKRGESIIPILLEQLRAEKDEHVQNDFIYIFRIMSRSGDLRGRQDVVDEIKHVVSQIKFYRTREAAQEALNEIETHVTADK